MITKIDKNAERKRRHVRVRKSVKGPAERPRLNVYRSTNHIYAQIIDDTKGVTLASASTLEKAVKTEIAGERAKEKGIETVVFDRGGYHYTGRVQALADGAREAGLNF